MESIVSQCRQRIVQKLSNKKIEKATKHWSHMKSSFLQHSIPSTSVWQGFGCSCLPSTAGYNQELVHLNEPTSIQFPACSPWWHLLSAPTLSKFRKFKRLGTISTGDNGTPWNKRTVKIKWCTPPSLSWKSSWLPTSLAHHHLLAIEHWYDQNQPQYGTLSAVFTSSTGLSGTQSGKGFLAAWMAVVQCLTQ